MAMATKGLWVALDLEGVVAVTMVLLEATVVEVVVQMAKARAASASAKALSRSKMRLLCRECPALCYQRAQVVLVASTTTQEPRPGVGEEGA